MIATKKIRPRRVAATAISPKELLRELPKAKIVTYEEGDYIFREGTKGGACCLLTHGTVRILKRTAKGDDIPLALIKPGEFLGEMAMLSGELRSASALAVTQVKVIVVTHNEFVKLLHARNPSASRLSLQLSRQLARRCHELLRLIAHQPEVVPLGVRNHHPDHVRAVLNRVYTLWAV